MTRHIVIEGPDGAGKTMLARALCEVRGKAYHHEGPPPNPGALEHYRSLLERSTPTVFDRLHLGELVYGPLLRGASQLNLADALELNYKADLIICLPPWETCLINTAHRKELIESPFVMHIAYVIWERLADQPDIAQWARRFDYTKEAFDVA